MRQVVSTKIFDDSLNANQTKYSDSISLNKYSPTGTYALQVQVTGNGTFEIKALCSLTGEDFRSVEGVSSVLSNITKTSGPNDDGKIYTNLPLGTVAKFLKLQVSETGGSSGGSLIIHLGIEVDTPDNR